MTVERDWFWFWFWFYYALWLAGVFTLVLVLRQSSENRSNLNNKSKDLPDAISIDNNIVSYVTSYKYLGVLIDEKLTFETHVEYICEKGVPRYSSSKKNFKPFVPLCTLVPLYNSLVQPYFDHCSPLWDICGKQLKDKVQEIQNRVGRVITGASYDIRLVDVLDNLKWKNLETRRSQIKTTPTYKILSQ